MKKQRICEYCLTLLTRKEQVRFCSLECTGLARRKGKVIYTFSADGKIGYGQLLTGETFIFDTDDFSKISNTMWYRSIQGAHGEIYITDCNSNKLHRVILNAPDGWVVDHINMNTLDNRKCNIRICTHRQNLCNRGRQANNTSSVPGVHWMKNRKTWNARIKYYGQEIHLGAYHSFLNAVQARNEGMKLLYTDFGRYNDVPEAPQHIKEYVKNKCSRYLNGTAVFIMKEVAHE